MTATRPRRPPVRARPPAAGPAGAARPATTRERARGPRSHSCRYWPRRVAGQMPPWAASRTGCRHRTPSCLRARSGHRVGRKRLLRGTSLRLITASCHKRRKHPHSMIVVFEQLGQALAELSCVLFCRPVPFRISFSPSFAELEVYGEIDSRLGRADNTLMTRTAIRRISSCINIRSVLQRRCQEFCKITCMLKLVHEPPPGILGQPPSSARSTPTRGLIHLRLNKHASCAGATPVRSSA